MEPTCDMNQKMYKYDTVVLVKEEVTQCSFLNSVEQLKLNRAHAVWKDGGCSDPAFAGKLYYSNGSIHCGLWSYSKTKLHS